MKPVYRVNWTPEALAMLGGIWTNEEISAKTGIGEAVIEKKRLGMGLGLKQRGIEWRVVMGPHLPNKRVRVRAKGHTPTPRAPKNLPNPLPDPLERGQRVLRIRDKREYRVAYVYPDLVHLIGVKTMYDPIIKVPLDKLSKLYEGKPSL